MLSEKEMYSNAVLREVPRHCYQWKFNVAVKVEEYEASGMNWKLW